MLGYWMMTLKPPRNWQATYSGFGTRIVHRANYERHVVVIRSQLGESIFAKAWAEGRTLTVEPALEKTDD